MIGIEGPHDIEIGGEQRQRRIGKPRLQDPRYAGEPLAAAPRFLAFEIVEAGAGMGVDDTERSRLLLKMEQDAHQHDVLDDIGKAAGMKGVTVVHARGLRHRAMKATVIPGWCAGTKSQMRNCASGILEVLGCAIAHDSSMLSHRPGMTLFACQPPRTGGMST